MSIDLSHVARDLGLPAEQVQRTLELLDEGNTVPFITRFRKDQIGGLDEEQVRRIQDAAAKQRQLEDRKQTILKSIESFSSIAMLRSRARVWNRDRSLSLTFFVMKSLKGSVILE